jgi:hypothetical protein
MNYQSHLRTLSGDRTIGDLEDYVVSATDHVRIPALYVVELFPPSEKGNLEKADKRNRWASNRSRMYAKLLPTLDEARSGKKWSWWPRPLGENFVAFRTVQEARGRLHATARMAI